MLLNLFVGKEHCSNAKVQTLVMKSKKIISLILICFFCFFIHLSAPADTQTSLILSFVAAAPTSFEGPYGRIIYRVRAFIDTPRFAKDYKIEKPFSMKNTVNLNEIPGIQVNVLHRPPYSKLEKKNHKLKYF